MAWPAPITGSGILPGGAAGDQAQSWTRRTFVPTVFVQTRNATPLTAALIGRAKPATGGVSSITVPMQIGDFVTTVASDYSGTFPPPANLSPGVNGQWNLKIIITPIPHLGMESLFQFDAAVIPILAPKMNDAGNSAAEYLSTQFWTNASENNDVNGLPLIAAASGNYAGLSRTTYPSLQANVIANSPAVDPTRARIMTYITSATKHGRGQMPTFGITGPGTWDKLAGEFIGVEEFRLMPNSGSFDRQESGPRSGFNALMVGGVPIYMDPAYGVDGTLYLFTGKYLSCYIHQAASWFFTGFQSTLANNQLGYVGALVTALELVDVVPSTVTVVTGLNSNTV